MKTLKMNKLLAIVTIVCILLLAGVQGVFAYDTTVTWRGSYVSDSNAYIGSANWYVISDKIDLSYVKTVTLPISAGLYAATDGVCNNWVSASFGVSQTPSNQEDYLAGKSSYFKWTANWATSRQYLKIDVSDLTGEYYLKLHMISNKTEDTNEVGISPRITLTMMDGAVIDIQPKDVTVIEGKTAVFTGKSGNAQGCSWQKKGEDGQWQELSEDEKYSGTKTQELSVKAELIDDGSIYRCVFIGRAEGEQTISEEARLTVKAKNYSGIRVKYPFPNVEIGERIDPELIMIILQYDNDTMDFADGFQGFVFLQEGAETETPVVLAGENRITVGLYSDDAMLTDTFTVNGADSNKPVIHQAFVTAPDGGELILAKQDGREIPVKIWVEAEDIQGLHTEGAYYFAPADNAFSYEEVVQNGLWQKDPFIVTGVLENKEYTIYVRDGFGNVESRRIQVTAFDTKEPWLELITQPDLGHWTKQITITAKAEDDYGLAPVPFHMQAVLENGEQIAALEMENSSITVSENGIYTVTAEDAAGNITQRSLNIQNIDKKVPEIAVTGSLDKPIDGVIYLLVKGEDGDSGIASLWCEKAGKPGRFLLKEYENNDSILMPGMKTMREVVEIRKNGQYSICLYDAMGNMSSQTLEIQSLAQEGDQAANKPTDSEGQGEENETPKDDKNEKPVENLWDRKESVTENIVISGRDESEILELLLEQDTTLENDALLDWMLYAKDIGKDFLWNRKDLGNLSDSAVSFMLPEQKGLPEEQVPQLIQMDEEEKEIKTENKGYKPKALYWVLLPAGMLFLLLFVLLCRSGMHLAVKRKNGRQSFCIFSILYFKRDGKYHVFLPRLIRKKGVNYFIVFSDKFAQKNLPLHLVMRNQKEKVQYFCDTMEVDVTGFICHDRKEK